MELLYRIAENILCHLEATGMPKKPHGPRQADAELIASILVETLTHEGFVRLEMPNGTPVRKSDG
jgi:hypothetical protein